MKLSEHNIISRFAESGNYFIINLLSKHADVLTEEEYLRLTQGKDNENEQFILNGYIVQAVEEELRYKEKYLEFLKNRDNDEVQLFFVPSYACNFACSYCYQGSYQNKEFKVKNEILDAFFSFVANQFSDRKKYLTLFGGEPLLNTPPQLAFFEEFIRRANNLKLDVALVTNGYNLPFFIDILKQASIREVQVTLDGLRDIHNIRRPLRNGDPTFDQIVRGIDLALENKFPINLRMVIDGDNINELPKLAKFASEKGWTENSLFKTQIGRNYELHKCHVPMNQLYSRLGLYQDIYSLMKKYPEIGRFYKPSFSITRFLFENGELPDPLFDSCPATKTEWAFDFTGKIYPCTATVGKQGEEIGTFFPEIKLNYNLINDWESRDVLSIDECRHCSQQLACGGGCTSVAKNKSGQINSPDCRPVKELMELGISYYFGNELNN